MSRQKRKTTIDYLPNLFKKKKGFGSFKFSPILEHYIPVQIEPIYNTKLNEDQTIYFDLCTGPNEYMTFPKQYQFILEVLTKITEVKAEDQSETEKLLDDSQYISYPPSSAALSLFDRISIQFQMKDITAETSMHWPYPAQFLQLQATSDLMFSSSEWIELQKSFGNYPPINTLKVQDVLTYKEIAKHKLHSDQNDKPPAKSNGKFLYGLIPFFPFRLASPYFEKFIPELNQKVLLPPLTNIRVGFRKQRDFDQISRMEYANIAVDDITSNQQLTEKKYGTGAEQYTIGKIRTEILSFKMCIEKIYVEPKHDILREIKLFTYTYNYSRYVVHPLTNHSSYELPIKWDSQTKPISMEFFFLRDQDLNYDSNYHCPVSLNRFFLPKQLETWELRSIDNSDKLFDNLFLTELNTNNVNTSKQNYLNYMKLHYFIPLQTKFEDVFSLNQTTVSDTGTRNIYPISFVGRNIEKSLILKGLKLFLKFNGSLSTKWNLVTKFNYLADASCRRVPNNLEFSFQTDETQNIQPQI